MGKRVRVMVGKTGRVKEGKREHGLRIACGENGRLWVGIRRKD